MDKIYKKNKKDESFNLAMGMLGDRTGNP